MFQDVWIVRIVRMVGWLKTLFKFTFPLLANHDPEKKHPTTSCWFSHQRPGTRLCDLFGRGYNRDQQAPGIGIYEEKSRVVFGATMGVSQLQTQPWNGSFPTSCWYANYEMVVIWVKKQPFHGWHISNMYDPWPVMHQVFSKHEENSNNPMFGHVKHGKEWDIDIHW